LMVWLPSSVTVEFAVIFNELKFAESTLVVGRVPPDQLDCAPQLPEALPDEFRIQVCQRAVKTGQGWALQTRPL
jgi:hypothetical protein